MTKFEISIWVFGAAHVAILIAAFAARYTG
jgi:hypothetical protein